MKTLPKVLIVGFVILFLAASAGAETLQGESIAEEILIEGVTPTPKKVISTLRFLIEAAAIKDPIKKEAVQAKFGANIVIDTAIKVIAENMENKGVFNSDGALGKYGIRDKSLFESSLYTAKNMILASTGIGAPKAIISQLLDQLFLVSESWEETVEALKLLPADEELPPGMKVDKSLRILQKLAKGTEWIKEKIARGKEWIKENTACQTPPQQKVSISNISFQNGLQEFQKLVEPFSPITAPFVQVVKPPSDASQLSQRIVGYVNKLDNVTPQLVSASIIFKSNDLMTFSYTFSEPMGSNFHVNTSGFGAGGGTWTWTDSWSSNRKIFTTTVSGNISPSGNIVNYTINPDPNVPPQGKFNDLSGNPAPITSGSFVIP